MEGWVDVRRAGGGRRRARTAGMTLPPSSSFACAVSLPSAAAHASWNDIDGSVSGAACAALAVLGCASAPHLSRSTRFGCARVAAGRDARSARRSASDVANPDARRRRRRRRADVVAIALGRDVGVGRRRAPVKC